MKTMGGTDPITKTCNSLDRHNTQLRLP